MGVFNPPSCSILFRCVRFLKGVYPSLNSGPMGRYKKASEFSLFAGPQLFLSFLFGPFKACFSRPIDQENTRNLLMCCEEDNKKDGLLVKAEPVGWTLPFLVDV
ncbi:hypothetical protein VNO77_44064 [Canavalia gladiata]|uniref:Uncharacterized protein n=1 Tax=Canavalia gladiata TaxID=3824 RepID=A0AAN9JWB5_CANGL